MPQPLPKRPHLPKVKLPLRKPHRLKHQPSRLLKRPLLTVRLHPK